MKDAGELERENEALRDRLSRLSQASLRINESLDFDTVLQRVLDSACSLTGARYGVITLLNESGRIQDFLYSGLTPEESRRFAEFPNGMLFFEGLSRIAEPLRLRDFHSYARELGLPEFRPPMAVSSPLPFLAAPLRHLGESVGAFYVGEKELEFTPEDEETLVMFASQAALVIANARRHREEQRTRADLETLVNTTPVGVLVLDAGTGEVRSINREARRIVSGLCAPGGTAEQLLEALTYLRADGREVSLRELPLAQTLSTGETVRAEEIVLQAPDGQSVTTLINATPILSEEGEVESVVVTIQDLTPLEELERLRAEFLGMVSHELRTPLAAIKGSAATLTEAASDLDTAEMLQFFRIIGEQADSMRDLIGDLLDVARIETGALPVSPAAVDVASLVDEARSAFQNGGGRSDLHIDIPPDLPRVMADRRRIVQVLSNLLSNAARHSERAVPHPGDRRAGRRPRRLLGGGRRRGRARRAAAAPVPQVLAARRRGAGTGDRRVGPGPCHLQGHRGGPRRPHPGRERRAGPGKPVHLHRSGGGGVRHPSPSAVTPAQDEDQGAAPRPLRGRRPADAPVRAGRPHEGGLRAHRDRRPGGGLPAHGGGNAAPGAAGHDAAGQRRHGADEGHPRGLRRAGHLPVRQRPGGGRRQGLRHGSGRLRGQALLTDGACGQDQGGPAQARGAGAGPALRALRAGRPDRRLSPAQGDGGRNARWSSPTSSTGCWSSFRSTRAGR